MKKEHVRIIWQLVILSFIAGLLLSYFDISPADLIEDVPDAIGRIFTAVVSVIEWGAKYILLGAVIVVPLWIILNFSKIFDKMRRK